MLCTTIVCYRHAVRYIGSVDSCEANRAHGHTHICTLSSQTRLQQYKQSGTALRGAKRLFAPSKGNLQIRNMQHRRMVHRTPAVVRDAGLPWSCIRTPSMAGTDFITHALEKRWQRRHLYHGAHDIAATAEAAGCATCAPPFYVCFIFDQKNGNYKEQQRVGAGVTEYPQILRFYTRTFLRCSSEIPSCRSSSLSSACTRTSWCSACLIASRRRASTFLALSASWNLLDSTSFSFLFCRREREL